MEGCTSSTQLDIASKVYLLFWYHLNIIRVSFLYQLNILGASWVHQLCTNRVLWDHSFISLVSFGHLAGIISVLSGDPFGYPVGILWVALAYLSRLFGYHFGISCECIGVFSVSFGHRVVFNSLTGVRELVPCKFRYYLSTNYCLMKVDNLQ